MKLRKVICAIFAVASFFFVMGVIGHIEHGYLPLKIGSWLCVGGCALFGAFIYGCGAIDA